MATAPAPTMETAWRAREREAQLLAAMLRSSRLTLLCGEAGVGKSRLLRDGVLPRLRRRASDRGQAPLPAAAHRGNDAAAVPDRRRRAGGSERAPRANEVAIYVNAWGEEPLAQLRSSLRAAFGKAAAVAVAGVGAGGADDAGPAEPEYSLCEEIATLSREQDARLLFVLDGFERYLHEPPDAAGSREFADEWVRVLKQPSLPANFLIAMRHDARPLLERFHRDLPALERNWLSLPALPALPALPVVTERAGRAAPADVAVASASASLAAPEPKPSPGSPSHSASEARAVAARRPRRGRPAVMGAMMALAVLALAVAISPRSPGLVTPAPMIAQAAPPLAPRTTPVLAQPAWPVQTGAEQRTDAQVAAELMRAMGGEAPPGARPALQITHYDALQAARAAPASPPSPPLRIVAALFPEELHVIVRADSPLTFIHQIGNSRINVGPAGPGGAPGTGAVLYQRLFGTSLPAAQARTQPWPEALAALESGSTDVVVLVDAQPSAWLAELSPAQRRRIKLLALDPGSPQSRQALRSFLPATLRAGPGQAERGQPAAGETPTLAVMSFLATTEPTSSDPALIALTQAWCRALPELRRTGHPKWREARPGQELPVGWPYVAATREALSACAPSFLSTSASPTPQGEPR